MSRPGRRDAAKPAWTSSRKSRGHRPEQPSGHQPAEWRFIPGRGRAELAGGHVEELLDHLEADASLTSFDRRVDEVFRDRALRGAGVVKQVEENVRAEDENSDAEHFLSYSLQASPEHLSLAKLAVERGHSEEIIDFGRTMLKQEEDLVKEVRILAAKRSIYPPLKLAANESNDFLRWKAHPHRPLQPRH